jgi:signal transduction histidine kinase
MSEHLSIYNPEPRARTPRLSAHDLDLHDVLEMWQEATGRLQETHETLRSEVRRLSDELEVKNRELARQNRLADLGRMAAHVAHEVRNNLTPMTLYSSLLARRLADDHSSLDLVAHIEAGLSALEITVNDLLHFTADRVPNWRNFDLHTLLHDICDMLSPQLAAQGVHVDIDTVPGTIVSADQEMVRRALLNLALNALDAMPEGGEIYLTACTTHRGLEIEVADSGPGVPEQVGPRVFEPFYTTKSDGTGLGLAIVHRVAQAHGGQVDVRNCADSGAAFTICIPVQQALRAVA